MRPKAASIAMLRTTRDIPRLASCGITRKRCHSAKTSMAATRPSFVARSLIQPDASRSGLSLRSKTSAAPEMSKTTTAGKATKEKSLKVCNLVCIRMAKTNGIKPPTQMINAAA